MEFNTGKYLLTVINKKNATSFSYKIENVGLKTAEQQLFLLPGEIKCEPSIRIALDIILYQTDCSYKVCLFR